MHTEKLRTIRLYGLLGHKFGRVHRLAVNSTAEAMKALCILIPGFERYLMESRDNGLTFAVFLGKQNIGPDLLRAPPGDSDIRIAPVMAGSKSGGIIQTIVGVALLAVAFFVPATAPYLVPAGIGLVAGGVVQMLSPVAKGLSTQDSPENRASYSFNGAVNTSVQGNPVPLLYGRMIVGSSVVSAGIYSEDQM